MIYVDTPRQKRIPTHVLRELTLKVDFKFIRAISKSIDHPLAFCA